MTKCTNKACERPEDCQGCFKKSVLADAFEKVKKHKFKILLGGLFFYIGMATVEVHSLEKENLELKAKFSNTVKKVNRLVYALEVNAANEQTERVSKQDVSPAQVSNADKEIPTPKAVSVEEEKKTKTDETAPEVKNTNENVKGVLKKAIGLERLQVSQNNSALENESLDKKIAALETSFANDFATLTNGLLEGKATPLNQIQLVETLKRYQYDSYGNKRVFLENFREVFPVDKTKDFSLTKFNEYMEERSKRYSVEDVEKIHKVGLFNYCNKSKDCTYGQGIIVNNLFGRPSIDFVGFEALTKANDKTLNDSPLLKMYQRVDRGVGLSLKAIETKFEDTTFAFIDLNKVSQKDLVKFMETAKRIVEEKPNLNLVIFPIDTGNDEKYDRFIRGATKYKVEEFIAKLKTPVEDYLVFSDVYLNEEVGKRLLEGNLGNQVVKLEQIGYIDDVILIRPLIESEEKVNFAMAFSLLDEKDLELWFRGEINENKE